MDSKEPTIYEKDIEESIDKVSGAEERKIVRKLDYLYVMPFIGMVCFLQVNSHMRVLHLYDLEAQLINDTHNM
jgi:hypothetical protein